MSVGVLRPKDKTGGGEILTHTRWIGGMGYQRTGKWISDESEAVKIKCTQGHSERRPIG